MTKVFMRRALVIILLANSCYYVFSQEVALVFFGDIMGHSPQINSARSEDGSTYDYRACFHFIEPYFRAAEISAGNLEVTLAGPPYTGYPTFSSPDALAYALKDAGVNILVTANNHSADRRKAGLERTMKVLDDLFFLRTDTFKDSTDKQNHHPLLISVYGIRLALLNYTYGTNDIPVTQPNIVNLIDRNNMSRDIEESKSHQPDKIIVFIHWGNEYQTTPNKDQTDLAQFLFDEGVDIIIGSHPHVIQPMHHYKMSGEKEKLVVYSLGNFISNQRKPLTDGGVMVRLVLSKNENETKISKAEHLLTWVHTPIVDGRKKYYVLPASVYQKSGVPDSVPKGYEGMYQYLKLAREVMQKNTEIPESFEEWPLR